MRFTLAALREAVALQVANRTPTDSAGRYEAIIPAAQMAELRLAADVLVDDRGRIAARHAAFMVWLCGMIAAGGGVLLADLVAWAVRHAT
jgi:hypothetical protein